MVTVETIGKVLHAFLVKGRSIKRIARELHLARNTVRGIVRGEETERRYTRADQPLPHYVSGMDTRLDWRRERLPRKSVTSSYCFVYQCCGSAIPQSVPHSISGCAP